MDPKAVPENHKRHISIQISNVTVGVVNISLQLAPKITGPFKQKFIDISISEDKMYFFLL